jgi:hypothetical protein
LICLEIEKRRRKQKTQTNPKPTPTQPKTQLAAQPGLVIISLAGPERFHAGPATPFSFSCKRARSLADAAAQLPRPRLSSLTKPAPGHPFLSFARGPTALPTRPTPGAQLPAPRTPLSPQPALVTSPTDRPGPRVRSFLFLRPRLCSRDRAPLPVDPGRSPRLQPGSPVGACSLPDTATPRG